MRRCSFAVVLIAASFVSGCRTDGTVTVRSLTFTGVHDVKVSQLTTAIATREDTKVPIVGIRLPWSKERQPFDQTRLDADVKRIEAFYAERGYPEATVSRVDVRFNTRQDEVDVTVVVVEGDPVRVAAIDLHGFDVLPASKLADLRQRLPLQVGRARDRQLVVASHDSAVNALRNEGYAYASVVTAEQPTGRLHEVMLSFTAETGPVSHFGPVEITGNRSVGAGIIRRQLLFKPGDLYRRSIVQDTQRRLYGMELFQFVNIESLQPDARNPEVRTRVTVAEGRHQRVKGGVGYGTEEKARVDGEYRHVNFLGGARSAVLHGRWSSLDRGARAEFLQPYLFSPQLSLAADGQRWYTFTPAYQSIVTGGRVAMTHRTSQRFSWTASISSQRTTSAISQNALEDPDLYGDLIALGLDPTTGKQEGVLGAFGFTLKRSATDNLLDPHRGYQVTVDAEQAGRLLPGRFHYHAVALDARHYHPFGGRFVLASRITAGGIRGDGNDPANVPFAKKYFLGGASSIRGWGRYEVSPLSESGLPIGGNAMLAFSSEVRVGLAGRAGGVAFLDAGNVWPERVSLDVRDLRYAVGTGLRYQTPVGPLRLDFGYQLNPAATLLTRSGQPVNRRWRIHFSVGQAF
jgi:outer membrane protein insertion porin family/translocation and assembly module TamA